MKPGKLRLGTGYGRELPPLKEHVRIYFSQRGLGEKQADCFYRQYDNRHWTDLKGRPIKNWKTLACDWIWEFFATEKKGGSVRLLYTGKHIS